VGDFTILVPDDDPILHQRVECFDFETQGKSAKEIERFLTDALLHHNALGVAANQLGLPHRAFAMLLNDAPFVVFNPIITELDPDCITMTEGCLSFPGKELNIRRPKTCRLNYSDAKGERHTLYLEGLAARCALHETDHLNGIVFTSKATATPFIFNVM
jgi:peptide deformylase